MAVWTIRANYDPEEQIWYSVDGDVPGLFVDGLTLEVVAEKAGAMLPDLLEVHAADFDDQSLLVGPHRIRIIAFHEREFDVAA